MVLFNLSYCAIDAVWSLGGSYDWPFWYPLAICTACGGALSLIALAASPARTAAKRSRADRAHEGESAAREGGVHPALAAPRSSDDAAERAKPRLAVRLSQFLIPLAGGGPVGIAFGIIGFAKDGFFWIAGLVRKCIPVPQRATDSARTHDGAPSDQAPSPLSRLRALRDARTIGLLACGIAGAVAGIAAVVSLWGVKMVIPHFGAVPPTPEIIPIACALAACGWALGSLYLACGRVARSLWAKGGVLRTVLPLACGIALGTSLAMLPHTGFPGSDEFSSRLLVEWTSVQPALLAATALIRCALVAFLLNMGWNGGPLLPLAYCSICLALGIAGAFGLDPAACSLAAIAGVLASFSGKPALGIATFLFCPLANAHVVGVALLASVLLARARKALFPLRANARA